VNIRRWHWGKLVIVWAWGGVVAALLLTTFLMTPAPQSPAVSTMAFAAVVGILLALTAVTWIWLGGKERQ